MLKVDKEVEDSSEDQVSEEDLTAMFDSFADAKMGIEKDEDADENEDEDEPGDEDLDEGESDDDKSDDDDSDDGESDGKDAAAKDGDPSPELKAAQDEIAELRHKLKSDDGRVSALHKKIAELEKQEAPASAVDFTKAFVDEASWKEFAETNEEMATPIQKFMEASAASIAAREAALEKRIADLEVLESETSKEADKEAIEAAIPGWVEMVNDSNNGFNEWKITQPPFVIDIIEGGNTEDSIGVLNNFRDHLIATGKLKDKPPADSGEEKPNKKVAETKKKRKQQLEDGAAPDSSGGSAQPTGGSESGSDLFNYFAKKKEDELARQRRR